MAHEYVFRGDVQPYAPSAADQRAREQAIQEAEQLVDYVPIEPLDDVSSDYDVARAVAEYQTGGLNAYGATSTSPSWQLDSEDDSRPRTRSQ